MQTNDFVQILKNIDTSPYNNLWNGFSMDRNGESEYEKHIDSLYEGYIKEINDHIDNLRLHNPNEVESFIADKITIFDAIR
jgi:hypothetical protein